MERNTLRQPEKKDYIEILPYTETKELSENLKDIEPSDDSKALSVTILKAVQNSNNADRYLLQLLTGVDLETEEKFYDYYQKALKVEKKDMAGLMVMSLSDVLSTMDTEKLLDDLRNLTK